MLHNTEPSSTGGRRVLRIVAPNFSPRCCFQLPCPTKHVLTNYSGTWSKIMNELQGKNTLNSF